MQGFDVVVRVVRLALESSGEGVETLEHSVAQVASAYGVAVERVLLDFALPVPTVAVAIAVGVITTDLVRNRRVGGPSA